MKQSLDDLMSEQRSKIKQQIKQLSRNNYFMQCELLRRQLSNVGYHQVQLYQRISAKYSIDIVNNLHSYIITYLNRLIHGLLTVAIKFTKLPAVSHIEWPSNINLITFQIMDLLRCQCSSGQKQIIMIYSQILKMSQSQTISLVKVVNRLRKGTNDILINIKYRQVLCEIQLSVTNKNNTFIQYSNNFNHYLYQLKRSVFGPVTQLCSIWKSIDQRFNYYQKINNIQCGGAKTLHLCSKQTERLLQSKPFICSECNTHFFHNNFIKNHLKCKNCCYWICAKCQIQQSDCKQMLSAAFKNQQVVSRCSKIVTNNPVPNYGICIHIQSTQIRVQPFRKYQNNKNYKIIGVKNKKLYQICQINSEQSQRKFKEKYLIFKLQDQMGLRSIKIDDQKIKQFLLQQRIKLNFNKNKQKLCLSNCGLNCYQLSKLCNMGNDSQKLSIKSIQMIHNRLQSVEVLINNFQNVVSLQLSKNNIIDFSNIQRLGKLQKLYANQNKLCKFPIDICLIQNLKELSLCQNQIETIPNQLGKLSKLELLKLGSNKIQQLPNSLSQLLNLKELHLKDNVIKLIPEFLQNNKKLEVLQLQNNKISYISAGLCRIQSLQSLNLSYNQLQSLPDNFGQLKSLVRCKLRHNKLKSISVFDSLKQLVFFDLAYNQISSLPAIQNLPNLTNFNLNYNNLQIFPIIKQCQSLKSISLAHNRLTNIDSITYLYSAVQIFLNHNQIQNVSEVINGLPKLQVLHLENNKISKMCGLKLIRLRRLFLSKNIIDSFSNVDLKQLEELDISNNQIQTFTWNIVPSLRRINICNNKLEALSLLGCFKIKQLHAKNNKLKEVPQIGYWGCLKSILLQHNCIKKLPKDLSIFDSIAQIGLGYNLITDIPKQILKLSNLQNKTFHLTNNPIQNKQYLNLFHKMAKSAKDKYTYTKKQPQIIYQFEEGEMRSTDSQRIHISVSEDSFEQQKC